MTCKKILKRISKNKMLARNIHKNKHFISQNARMNVLFSKMPNVVLLLFSHYTLWV
jgi:hypothetical protein